MKTVPVSLPTVLFLIFSLSVFSTIACAENISVMTETRYVQPTVLGIPQDILIEIVVGIIILYFVIRVIAWMQAKKKEQEAFVGSAKDTIAELQKESGRLKMKMEAAKNSYYKRELSEDQANKLLFEYKQKLMDVETELKRLGAP